MDKIKKIIIAQLKSFAPAIGLALAITLFSVIAASVLYSPKKIIKRGFEIALSADGKAVEKKPEKPVDLASLMALADVNRGAKIFKKCASCHNSGRGEGAKVGPNLFGIVGRTRAASPGFSYSEAMKKKGGNWDRDSINQFIAKPKDFISGTKMAFPGLKKPQDRADVILFLEKQK